MQLPCQPEGFRATEPVALWSKTITVRRPYEEFQAVTVGCATQARHRYTGFLLLNDGVVDSFTRMRYPRRKYGVPSVNDCETGMQALARHFNAVVRPDAQQRGFRVVLGLIEGYDAGNKQHAVAAVQDFLPKGVAVRPGLVFSIRLDPHPGIEPLLYTEPAAILSGSRRQLPAVYDIANAFKQERFTVEDFDEGRAYVVETPHCSQPD